MATRGLHDVQVIDHRLNGDSPRGAPEAKNRLRFEDFFVSEGRRLFGALYVVTRDPNEAEEIGQEAFVRVLERWDRVAAMTSPAGYLYRVAMNIFRSRRRRERVASSLPYPAIHRDELAAVDDRDAATRLLTGLKPSQRAALILTAAFDYSSEEAGAILGVPGSSVRVLTMRARDAVRRASVTR